MIKHASPAPVMQIHDGRLPEKGRRYYAAVEAEKSEHGRITCASV